MSELRDAIKNAADREGVPYIEVNPAYTSKTCSECGALNKELKSEKEWTCKSCGVVHDRDTNAANNLQKMGKQYLDDIKNKDDAVIEWETLQFLASPNHLFAIDNKEVLTYQIKAPV